MEGRISFFWVVFSITPYPGGMHLQMEDGGFPNPVVVPAIYLSNGDLPPFADPQALYNFLKPPTHLKTRGSWQMRITGR